MLVIIHSICVTINAMIYNKSLQSCKDVQIGEVILVVSWNLKNKWVQQCVFLRQVGSASLIATGGEAAGSWKVLS